LFCITRNEVTNILLTTNFHPLVTLAGTISNSPITKLLIRIKPTHFNGLQIHHLQIDNLGGVLVGGDNEVNAVWILDSVFARDHP